MVGVAPPAIGSAAPPAAPPPAASASGAGGAAGAQPRSQLKGTMIGIAPPSLGSPVGAAPTNPPAPGAAAPPGSGSQGSPQTSQIPSKLKGTMIGVAPPSLGSAPAGTPGSPPAGADAMAATMAIPSQAPQIPGAGAAPGSPSSPGGLARTEVIPAVKPENSVNPLGGTVLGNPAPDFGAAAGNGPALDKTALGQPPPPQGMNPSTAEPPPGGYGLGALAATSPAGGNLQSGASGVTGVPGAGIPATGTSVQQAAATSGNQQLAVHGGPRGPVGKVRNPVSTLLLGMLCFVYGLIAFVQMIGELKAFRQKNDLSLLLFFIPIINLIELLKLPEKVIEAQRMAGIQNPQVAHPVLYLFFGLYFLAADLNEAWEAARRN